MSTKFKTLIIDNVNSQTRCMIGHGLQIRAIGNLGSALKATFFGAVGGAATFGIGSIFTTGAGDLTTLAFNLKESVGSLALTVIQGGTHAISQGVLGLMQGADFVSSAVAGFAGSLGASGWESVVGNSGGSMIAFGALAGGVGSSLSGGNFWEGALIGGVVAGLNHAMHSIENDDEYMLTKNGKTIKVGNKGGNKTDYLYDEFTYAQTAESRVLLATADVQKSLLGPGYHVTGDIVEFGYRGQQGYRTGGLYDPSFDVMTTYVGGAVLNRFVSGAKFMFSTKVGGQFSLGYLDKPTKFMIRLEKHSLPKIGGGRGYPAHFNIEKIGSFNKHIFPNPKNWGKYKVR